MNTQVIASSPLPGAWRGGGDDPVMSCLQDIDVTSVLIQDALMRIEVLRVDGDGLIAMQALDRAQERLSAWGVTLMASAIALTRGEHDTEVDQFDRMAQEIQRHTRATLSKLRELQERLPS